MARQTKVNPNLSLKSVEQWHVTWMELNDDKVVHFFKGIERNFIVDHGDTTN